MEARGLHVIVAVEKDGRFARGFERFRVDEAVQIGRNNFNRFKARGAEIVRDHERAPRSISGLCSLLALTLGMRKSSAKLRQMLIAATYR